MDWRTHRCTHIELHSSLSRMGNASQFSIESLHHLKIMHSSINSCCQNYVGLVQAEAA